jgi:hypothetical protein
VTPVSDAAKPAVAPLAHPSAPSRLVGRLAEMADLEKRFGLALSGQRQIVFVTGEPGIGKSALVDAFTDRLDRSAVKIAHGQCLDHHGVGEPYLPLIEALTRLGASADGARIRTILATHAPSWLAQMPSLWTRSERSALEARGRATRERMLRELTSAVETIAADAPLLLTLEDIHWSDASTLDWLAHVARRPDPARLMVLATFRPADAAAISAGLGGSTAELGLHGRCHEIALSPLDLDAIEAYLAARLGDGDRLSQPHEIARLLLERTGGNPLFMVSIVNQLALQPSAAATPGAIMSIPHDVRRFIDRQIDDLDDGDRELLTAASVIRREFATAAVAAALETREDAVEAACARLVRQGVFIVKSGSATWPDGTPAELYAFRHDLYRELLYDRLPLTRRALSMRGSAAGWRPRGPAAWMRSRPSWRSISSAVTSSCAPSPITSAPPPRLCAAVPTTRRLPTCGAHSTRSDTSRTKGSAPGSRSSCALESESHAWRCTASAHRRRWRPMPGPRRSAIAWGSAPISFRRSGASGCSAPAAARSTLRDGCA